ncbi:MAG: hypothetical protein ACRC3J_01155 [Culicoidibacterales bacterium]
MKKQIAILASIATVGAFGVVNTMSASANVSQSQPTGVAVATNNEETIVSSDFYLVEENEDGTFTVTDQDGNVIPSEDFEFGETVVVDSVEPFGLEEEIVGTISYTYSIEENEDGTFIVTDQDGNIVKEEGMVIGKTE